MDNAAATLSGQTVRDQMPWVTMTFDYTDRVCAHIPEGLLDWRPEDPQGRFSFSLAEIAMHSADERRVFARQLADSDDQKDYWCTGRTESGVWEFRPGTRVEILESLQSSRAELDPILDWPIDRLLEVTAGTRAAFAKALEHLKEHSPDQADDLLRRGPAGVMRVLMAAAVHEAGHRGTLYTLLRQHGVNLPVND